MAAPWRIRRATLTKLLYTALGAALVWSVTRFDIDATALVLIACAVCLYLCIRLYKFDYLHPGLAYLFPWLLILVFSIIPISSHARPIEYATYTLLLANMFAWMFGCVISPVVTGADDTQACGNHLSESLADFRGKFDSTVSMGFLLLYAFAVVNVLVAGYIPFISMIMTGDSRYGEFGVHSVYGAFLAYANSVGCLAFYAYLRTHRRKYLALFLSILVMHCAFVTRQNLVTLMLEAFVIRSLVAARFSKLTLMWSIALSLLAFSALGTLRSGDIKQLIGVQPEYDWIPTSLIWVYAYSYFNALNLDNAVAFSGAPFFDGSMWQSLLPTIFRQEVDHGTYLELTNLNVSSYVYPVYIDIGKGVVLWTFFIGILTSIAYRRAVSLRRFVDVATYGCLLFCALLSFFSDCWLYLPVIFQLFFFWIFHVLLFRKHQRSPAPNNLVQA